MATSTTARRRTVKNAAAETPARQSRQALKLKRLLRTVLLMLVVITASIGVTLYFTWPNIQSSIAQFFQAEAVADTLEEPAPVRKAPVIAEKPLFFALEPFTVTLLDGGRSRILHVAITLRVADEATSKMLTEYMPMLRDRALRTLSAQHPTHIQSPEGREQLVHSLLEALKAPYDASASAPHITDVLFTAFVIQ